MRSLHSLGTLLGALALSGMISGCASTSTVSGDDPFEGLNRTMHGFNKGVDTVAVRPLSKGYDFIVPETIKHIVNNEVRFVALPGSLANSLLQGDFDRAGETAARLFINATMGGLGALDPATEMGIPEHDEDFGQTMAVWGVGSGPYVELPLLGPNTVRSTVGYLGDFVLDPLSYVGSGANTSLALSSIKPVKIVDIRYRYGDLLDEVLYESEDSYSIVKNTYLQRRRSAIMNGQVTEEDLPDISDSDDF